MKKLTDEQIQKLIGLQKELLEKIDIFYSGLMFPELFATRDECPRKQWIQVLRPRVKRLDLEERKLNSRSISDYTDFELGMALEKYFAQIREIFLEEFGKIISPFDTIIPEYESALTEILK